MVEARELAPTTRDDGQTLRHFEVTHDPTNEPTVVITIDIIPTLNRARITWDSTNSIEGFLNTLKTIDDVKTDEIYGEYTPLDPSDSDSITASLDGIKSYEWYPHGFSYLEVPFTTPPSGVAWQNGDPPQITVTGSHTDQNTIRQLFDQTSTATQYTTKTLRTTLLANVFEILETHANQP